jgi:hypothetical protein
MRCELSSATARGVGKINGLGHDDKAKAERAIVIVPNLARRDLSDFSYPSHRETEEPQVEEGGAKPTNGARVQTCVDSTSG